MYSWRISRTWGAAVSYLGIVKAVDKESAVKKAIEEFEITDPQHQKRLDAQRRD
jgi:hypothetical protein